MVFCWCWDAVAKRREKISRGEALKEKEKGLGF